MNAHGRRRTHRQAVLTPDTGRLVLFPDRRQRRSNTKPEVSNASGFNGVEVDADGFVVAINGRAIF